MRVWIVMGLVAASGFTCAQGLMPRKMLAAHNAERARVGLRPLVWSNRLEAVAQEWANTLLERNQFAHRQHPVFGENLYEITGAAATPAQVAGGLMR